MLQLRYHAFFLTLLTACTFTGKKPHETKSDTTQPVSNTGKSATSKKVVTSKFSNIDEVVSDTSGIVWGNYIDNPTSILHFNEKGSVQIEYYGQCWYTYPITLTKVDELGRCIVIQWNDDMDCKFDIGFNKLRNNVPKPTKRSRFAIFNLQNDTLFAHYLYPEWVREMNKTDTSLLLFPESFAARTLD